MIFQVKASCGSFIGDGRNNNEDNFYFNQKHLPEQNKGLKNPIKYDGATSDSILFAVFDGMGGEVNGEEASCRASEVFADEYKKLEGLALSGKELMIRACQKANDVINEIAESKHIGTMGTTVAAVYLTQDEVVSCNMGDSKIFRIREGQMVQISEDHTDEKIIQSMGLNKKPVLLQYLGISDTEMAIDPYITKGDIQDGDVFVLCSDGVTDFLSSEEMYELIKDRTADEATRCILAEVDKKGGSDNATIIIAKMTA
ncbi:MAG: serine/threonine-protein phosphatase [Lachnospiraceae bacterium]|nr:serine/threonine-protein phosphatase [Lachnospiraceae bacterium]